MNSKKIKNIFNFKFDISYLDKIERVIKSFSLTEKVIFWFLTIILSASTATMLYQINKNFLVEVPAKGGSLVEGSIGSPRFINPVLAISNTDRDLAILIYSGLLRATPEGDFIPDLAESYTISDDGLVYTFKIRDDAYFSDNSPVTADDIEFTIRATQDNIIKSPKRANWDGVKIQKNSDKEIQFILKTPYSSFLENATIGILPKHIWGEIAPEEFAFSNFNIEPIGSGPYKITKVSRNSSGVLEKYNLKAFKKFTLGEPYITTLTLRFFPNEEQLINAYKRGAIESINTISPEQTRELEDKGAKIGRTPLPRIFGVFFNQNENQVFANKEVRIALDKSLDKQKIVDQILSGYGTSIDGPVPPSSKYFYDTQKKSQDLEEAINILEKNGWEINDEGIREKTTKKTSTLLSFTISTSDAPELKAVANILKEQWEKLGAQVKINVFEAGDLNQNIIRSRNYDALLFGEVVGRDMDLYAFWHSSQRNDPGLNIAMYANITADKLLEGIRSSHNEDDKISKLNKFQKEISNDTPAIFIYSPDFIYIYPEKIKNFSMNQITAPSERFLNIYNWNIKTDTLWEIFI